MTSKSRGNKLDTKSPDFKGFVNYSLRDSDKEDAKKWLNEIDVEAVLGKMIDNGYKASLSSDARSGRYLASLSIKEGENAGWILTARGSTPFTALGRVIYLHVRVFQGGGWDVEGNYDDEQW
jgi:hypothetical protein